MEFTIAAGDFASALSFVKGAVPARATIPQLNNVMIETEVDRIRVTGSRMDLQASVTDTCEGIETGVVTIPGHALLGLVKGFAKDKLVTLKAADSEAVITCGRSRYRLPTLPADDFPIMPDTDEGEVMFFMPSEKLKEAIDQTRPTASTEQTQFHLTGILVCIDSNGLSFVTTDRHRLSRIVNGVPKGAEAMTWTLIPSDAASQIAGLCGAIEGHARIVVSSTRLSVYLGTVCLKTRLLIAKDFPDYETVMRTPEHTSFAVTAGALSDAIARLLVMGSAYECPTIKFKTNGTAIDVTIGQRSAVIGSESVEAEIGKPAQFIANARYVADLVGLWPPKSRLEFAAPEVFGPILITSRDVPHQTQAVMPTRG